MLRGERKKDEEEEEEEEEEELAVNGGRDLLFTRDAGTGDITDN